MSMHSLINLILLIPRYEASTELLKKDTFWLSSVAYWSW